jgi:hypothetical protein
MDLGDLPDGYGTYVGSDGARHTIGNLRLGTEIDADYNGQPLANALGDDRDDTSPPPPNSIPPAVGDDEDGVTAVGNWSNNSPDNKLDVVVTGGDACLNVWVDWGNGTTASATGNGQFDGPAEHVIVNRPLSATSHLGVGFDIDKALPLDAADNALWYMRVRLTPQDPTGGCDAANAYGGTASPTGLATGGEVEDYFIEFDPTSVTLTSLTAQWGADGVLVRWDTASEAGTVGFNVYRADSRQGSQTKLNQDLIAADGGAVGANYKYLDATAQPGRSYYYWLESVDAGGGSSRHGPAVAGQYQMYVPMIFKSDG